MRLILVSDQPVRCLAYSPDGRLLVTGDEGQRLRLWKLPDGAEARPPLETADSVETVAFHPDGRLLAAGLASGDLLTWSTERFEEFQGMIGHPGGVRALSWTGDGRALISAGWDRTVKFQQRVLPSLCETVALPSPVTSLASGRDNGVTVAGDLRGGLQVVGPRKGGPRVESGSGVFALALAPGGALLAAGTAAGRIELREVASLRLLGELTGHEWTVYGLGFTPDGGRLVSGSADGMVRIWNVRERAATEVFRWHLSWVTCLAVSPDGMTAAAGSADGTVAVWDLADL